MELNTFDELYPSRFLKACHFADGPLTFTIAKVRREELESEDGPSEKIVVSFKGETMDWVMPKVCAVCLQGMFGNRVPDWIGKRVTLYATDKILPFSGARDKMCIRVYGSPDITQELPVQWRPPKRKVLTQVMKPTGTAPQPAAPERSGAELVASCLKKLPTIDTMESLDDCTAYASKLFEDGKVSESEMMQIINAIDERGVELQDSRPLATGGME